LLDAQRGRQWYCYTPGQPRDAQLALPPSGGQRIRRACCKAAGAGPMGQCCSCAAHDGLAVQRAPHQQGSKGSGAQQVCRLAAKVELAWQSFDKKHYFVTLLQMSECFGLLSAGHKQANCCYSKCRHTCCCACFFSQFPDPIRH